MGKKQNWSNLEKKFTETVQDAIRSGNFSALNDLVSDTVTDAVYGAGKQVKKVTVELQENWNRNNQGKSVVSQSEETWKQTKRTVYDKNNPIWSAKEKLLPSKIKTREIGKLSSILYLVFGGIGTGFGALMTLIFCALVLDGLWAVPFLVFFALILIGSLFLVRKGFVGSGRLKRMKRYVELCAGRMYINMEELARNTNKSVDYVHKDTKKMLELGFFPEGHLDEKETCLILSDKAYHEYMGIEQQRKEFEAQEAQKAREQQEAARQKELRRAQNGITEELQEMIDEGHDYIAKIRRMNDLIEGQVFSDKLYRMEDLLEEIFSRLEEAPEQMPKMHKLMTYYLPTTLKLVEAYEEFDNVKMPSENVLSAKAEIENTIDTINEAFQELLNKLFMDDTLDVTTDAQVLKTMLAKEGLTKQM